MAGVLGVAVALLVVRVGVHATADSRAYVDQPAFGVFGGLVLLLVPVCAVLGVVSARWAAEIRALPPDNDRPGWQVLLAWLGAAVVIGALLWAQGTAMRGQPDYPDGQLLRIVVMATVVAFAAGVPIVALWGLSRAAAAIEPAANDAVERFSDLWARQRAFLGVLSLMLALVMLATAAKLQANAEFTASEGSPLPELPGAYVLVVGALYGAIVLGAYLPPYYATRRAGEQLARALPDRAPTTESGQAELAAVEERSRHRAAMGLDESTRQHVERGAGMLAPLLTALVATLIPGV
jgi:hypothetical protein